MFQTLIWYFPINWGGRPIARSGILKVSRVSNRGSSTKPDSNDKTANLWNFKGSTAFIQVRTPWKGSCQIFISSAAFSVCIILFIPGRGVGRRRSLAPSNYRPPDTCDNNHALQGGGRRSRSGSRLYFASHRIHNSSREKGLCKGTTTFKQFENVTFYRGRVVYWFNENPDADSLANLRARGPVFRATSSTVNNLPFTTGQTASWRISSH